MTEIPASKSGRSLLDEDSFQKLLAAAYVLQEHREQLRISTAFEAPEPDSPELSETETDYTQTLAEIVETQHQIQKKHLDLRQAMDVIAERVRKFAHADGAAIGILQDKELVYQAASGSAAHLLETRTNTDSCLSAQCLRNGASSQCPEVISDLGLDSESCRQQGINALVAVPIYSQGKVAGAIELHFAKANAFQEHDVRTCQLMAGLVTEALARAAELDLKQILAAERATMIEALEKLKPQLQRLANVPEAVDQNSASTACTECGSALSKEELFCGTCGAERGVPKAGGIQSKWASMWHLSQSQNNWQGQQIGVERESQPLDDEMTDILQQHQLADLDSETEPFAEEPSPTPWLPAHPGAGELRLPKKNIDELEEQTLRFGDDPGVIRIFDDPKETTHEEVTDPDSAGGNSSLKPRDASPWTSAAKAKAWLESLHEMTPKTAFAYFWRARRADIYLGLSILLVLAALLWGSWSHQSTTSAGTENSAAATSEDNPAGGTSAKVASKRKPRPPEIKLSLAERMLVGLGLAEAPPLPVYNGSPDTKVWVDLQTGLYYCPGSDPYGNTPKGKFTSQRDAQMDQFEPAYRKACD